MGCGGHAAGRPSLSRCSKSPCRPEKRRDGLSNNQTHCHSHPAPCEDVGRADTAIARVGERAGKTAPGEAAPGAHLEVRLVEVVVHVPANLPELPPLLHHGVEEGQHVDQGPERGVRAPVQRLVRDLEVSRSHVELEPVGRLRDNLSGARPAHGSEECAQRRLPGCPASLGGHLSRPRITARPRAAPSSC